MPRWYQVAKPPPHMATLACVSLGSGRALGFHSGRPITCLARIHADSHVGSAEFVGTPKRRRHTISGALCLLGRRVGLRLANTTACNTTLATYSAQHASTSLSLAECDAIAASFCIGSIIGTEPGQRRLQPQ